MNGDMADSKAELLGLVKRALEDAQQPEFSLSRLIEQAIRIASQRNDAEIIASLDLETVDYDDRNTRMGILQRLRTQLPTNEYDAVTDRVRDEYEKSRVASFTNTATGGEPKLFVQSIGSIEQMLSMFEQQLREGPRSFDPATRTLELAVQDYRAILGRVRRRILDYLIRAEREILQSTTETSTRSRGLATATPATTTFLRTTSDPAVSRVFVSYSQDSPAHKERVLDLADRLLNAGVDCHLDQYEESPPEGWPRWMINQVMDADYVLVVCTEIYRRRFEGKEEEGKGLGAQWEGAILTQQLYDAAASNTRFIPVLFSKDDATHIPIVLRGATYYRVDTEEGYERLYRRLTGQPSVVKPALGQIQRLGRRQPAQSSSTAAETEGDSSDEADDGWRTYGNRKFAYQIRHPSAWPIGGVADNGDGAWFFTGDLDSEVSVYASWHFPDIAPLEVDRRGLSTKKFDFDSGLSGELLYGNREGWRVWTVYVFRNDVVAQFWARGTDAFIRDNYATIFRMARSLTLLDRPVPSEVVVALA